MRTRWLVLWWLGIAVWGTVGRAETVYVLTGNPSQIANRNLISWPSLSDFTTNTNEASVGTRTSAAESSGISITADGTFYQLVRDATTTGTATLMSWSSASDYASGAVGTTLGTSASLGPSSGFHIASSGATYFLEGDPRVTSTSTRNLYRWSSIANFAAGNDGTLLGSTSLAAGLGLSVGDNEIYFLQGSPVTTGNKSIVVWPTLSDFFSNTNSTTYNNASTSTQVNTSGLAIVVPEPSALLLASFGVLAGGIAICGRCRPTTSC